MAEVHVFLVGAFIGLLVGQFLYAATDRFRDDPTSLWRCYLWGLLFVLSGTVSWVTTAHVRMRQQAAQASTMEVVLFGVAAVSAIGFGFVFGSVWTSWRSLTVSNQKIARRFLLLLGTFVLACACVLWSFWGFDPPLTLALVTLAGLLLGLFTRHRGYAYFLTVVLNPDIFSLLLSATVGVLLASTPVAQKIVSIESFYIFLLGVWPGLVVGMLGWFIPRREILPAREVRRIVNRANEFAELNDWSITPEERLSVEEICLLTFSVIQAGADALLSQEERDRLARAWEKVGALQHHRQNS
jgi:hypothetical protein